MIWELALMLMDETVFFSEMDFPYRMWGPVQLHAPELPQPPTDNSKCFSMRLHHSGYYFGRSHSPGAWQWELCHPATTKVEFLVTLAIIFVIPLHLFPINIEKLKCISRRKKSQDKDRHSFEFIIFSWILWNKND